MINPMNQSHAISFSFHLHMNPIPSIFGVQTSTKKETTVLQKSLLSSARQMNHHPWPSQG